jgi:hypothetical protein
MNASSALPSVGQRLVLGKLPTNSVVLISILTGKGTALNAALSVLVRKRLNHLHLASNLYEEHAPLVLHAQNPIL